MKALLNEDLTKTNQAEIEDYISKMEGLVNPNTPVLTPQERQTYGKGNGNSNKLLVADVKTQKTNQPHLKSELINWEEFDKDYLSSSIIEGWLMRLYSIAYKLESAKMMHDYNNYNAAIDQYTHLEYLSRNNVQGAAEAHRQLKEHFKKNKSNKNDN